MKQHQPTKENHVHLSKVPHELGLYGVMLISRDGQRLAHIYLAECESTHELDEFVLAGKKIIFDDLSFKVDTDA